MVLAPLKNIFTQEHLYRYGIDANKIRDWFIPMEKEFCHHINAKAPASEQLACTPPKPKCGLNDNCKFDEICRSGFNESFICGDSHSDCNTVSLGIDSVLYHSALSGRKEESAKHTALGIGKFGQVLLKP